MDDAAVLPARHRLDVDLYYRMADAGMFGQDGRIELLDGDLIDMAPIGQGHVAVVNQLVEALFMACGRRAIVSAQNPVRLDRWSEPQPDLAILRRRADFYATGERAGPAHVLLLVEVADSSLAFDRNVKLPIYARAGIGEVWIVDLKRCCLTSYQKPFGDSYGDMSVHQPGEEVALALAPEIVARLDLMFG